MQLQLLLEVNEMDNQMLISASKKIQFEELPAYFRRILTEYAELNRFEDIPKEVTLEELLDKYLRYTGIIGYTKQIMTVVCLFEEPQLFGSNNSVQVLFDEANPNEACVTFDCFGNDVAIYIIKNVKTGKYGFDFNEDDALNGFINTLYGKLGGIHCDGFKNAYNHLVDNVAETITMLTSSGNQLKSFKFSEEHLAKIEEMESL